jgi:hypothetical protein
MKTSYLLFFGIAAVVLIAISLWDCKSVKAYSGPNSFSIYEGIDDEEEGFKEEEPEEGFKEEEPEEGFSDYTFSDVPSSMSCPSGLSTSTGNLCLSKEHQMMLRSRGGNSSTGEAQIGN